MTGSGGARIESLRISFLIHKSKMREAGCHPVAAGCGFSTPRHDLVPGASLYGARKLAAIAVDHAGTYARRGLIDWNNWNRGPEV